MQNKSREDVLKTLDDLLHDLSRDPDSWENSTLERYLEAMHAWIDGYGKKYDPPPSWEFIINMLEAAKIYE